MWILNFNICGCWRSEFIFQDFHTQFLLYIFVNIHIRIFSFCNFPVADILFCRLSMDTRHIASGIQIVFCFRYSAHELLYLELQTCFVLHKIYASRVLNQNDNLTFQIVFCCRYSAHEHRVTEIATELGFHHVSMSSHVSPMVKVVPRGYTACADAYLTPKIKVRYSSAAVHKRAENQKLYWFSALLCTTFEAYYEYSGSRVSNLKKVRYSTAAIFISFKICA